MLSSLSPIVCYNLPPIDVYTGNHLSKKAYSVEHLIPRRIFRNIEHANDLLNIVPCDGKVNQLRADYRFGDLDNLFLNENVAKQLKLKDRHFFLAKDRSGTVSGLVHRRLRTFYPSFDADKGLIGRSIIKMLTKYPYLYGYLDEIVDNPVTLSRWVMYPKTEFEMMRDEFLEKKYNDKE